MKPWMRHTPLPSHFGRGSCFCPHGGERNSVSLLRCICFNNAGYARAILGSRYLYDHVIKENFIPSHGGCKCEFHKIHGI